MTGRLDGEGTSSGPINPNQIMVSNFHWFTSIYNDCISPNILGYADVVLAELVF